MAVIVEAIKNKKDYPFWAALFNKLIFS